MTDGRALENLARIVRALDAASADASALDAVLDIFADGRTGVFTGGALLKTTYGNRPFVLGKVRRYDPKAARSWMRWPLRRLFTRMKPARILDPMGSGSFALAIPFQYGNERYVVIGTLAEGRDFADCEAFFSILESVTIPKTTVPESSAHLPATPSDPRILGLGLCPDLLERVREALDRRGWPLQALSSFKEAWPLLEDSRADVIAVDTCGFADPTAAFTTIHRAADSAALQVLAFIDAPPAQPQSASVVDRWLPHGAGARAIFGAVKELGGAAARLRRLHAVETEEAMKRDVARALNARELVDFAASTAAASMSGWATVVLQDEYGAVYRSERCAENGRGFVRLPILAAMPKGFLDERPVFALNVDDAFLGEVTERAGETLALRALEPRSGASIPLDLGEARRGVLVALSQHRWADLNTFDELSRLARVVECRFRELTARYGTIPEFRRERHWERLRDRTFGLDVYRSVECETPWHYRMIGDWRALLTLGLASDGTIAAELNGRRLDERTIAHALSSCGADVCFAAAIDLSSNSLSYATRGFSPPFVLNGLGPVGSIAVADGMTAGVAELAACASAIICDSGLWRWFDGQRGYDGGLPELLEVWKPPGFASIVRLGSPQN